METLFPLLVAALEVFNRCGLEHVMDGLAFTNSRVPLPTMSAANMKLHINLSLNFANSSVSTFYSLTWPPHPFFSFPPLAAPANTLVSLLLQLMKGTVLAESSYFINFHHALSVPAMSRDMSQVGVALFLSF